MSVLETKKINLGKLPEIEPSDWLKIGRKLVQKIQLDTKKGISQDDSAPNFAEYSKWYREFKQEAYPFEGNATNSQVTPPNLTYTGKMVDQIHAKNPTKEGVTIEFLEGERVLENIRIKNRNIFDINAKNMEWIANEVVKIFDKNEKKIPNKTTYKV